MIARKLPSKIRVLAFWFLSVLLLLIYFYLVYPMSTYEVVKISNLSVAYKSSNQMITSETIPVGVNHLFVCGKITARESNYLSITLHSTDEKRYYGKVGSDERLPPGDFCNEIMLRGRLDPGSYKIIVVDGHERAGELIFQVK